MGLWVYGFMGLVGSSYAEASEDKGVHKLTQIGTQIYINDLCTFVFFICVYLWTLFIIFAKKIIYGLCLRNNFQG